MYPVEGYLLIFEAVKTIKMPLCHPVYYLLPVLLLYGRPLRSQNLVKNPSFEGFRNCPDRLGNFHTDVVDWSAPTEGSTDYFNACSEAMGTPENFNGSQPSEFGRGYAGLYLYAPNDYREYVQGELREPLIRDRTYTVSFYISLAERSDFAVNVFGIVLSADKLDLPIKKQLSKMQLYRQKSNRYTFAEIPNSEFYNETSDWLLLQTEFKAAGGERYFTIGNFEDNARTRTYKTSRNAKQGAYYYLDMVRISNDPDVSENSPAYALDTQHPFRNVLFDFDDFRLKGPAKTELKKLYAYLEAHTELHITIDGHTDNLGTAEYNRRLSGYRCQSVTDYLKGLGLAADRIRWVSHGSEQPVADNSSEEGRRQNRRVVFRLSRESAD